MTTYCAPCLADLALVREAATAVNGTASCMAHAVLLTHPGDDPQRRRQRLAQLRDTATEKMATAGSEESMRLEVLVEEYSLASAMESLAPRRRSPEEGGPLSRSARKRRGRDGRERPDAPRPEGQRSERPRSERGPGGPGAGGGGAIAAAPGGAVADGGAEQVGAAALEQVGAPSGEPPATSGDSAPGGAPASSPGDAPSGGSAPSEGSAGADRTPAPVPAQDNAPASTEPARLSMAGEPAPVKPVEGTAPPAVDGAVPSPPSAPASGDETSSG